MPLLEGQPFKLINPPEVYPVDSEIYTIQHTGEKFLKKSDYEDRLALYSQTIWTCQCTGHTGLTHKEAWMSEAKTRVAAKTAVPLSLQKPLLTLVHHSLSPLEQLIDAAYILCHSQFHVGEELIYTCEKPIQVRITVSKDIPKVYSDNLKHSSNALFNGKPCDSAADTFVNGTANGVSKDGSPGALPDKENEAKDSDFGKEDSLNRKVMLPKLYDVITEDNKRIENVPSKKLMRPYKLPSKDQLRLFIRSCALRHRGSTCTPWVVSDDLVKKFNISNKLPSLFLSSPKPNLSSFKRKAPSMAGEVAKRPKPDVIKNKKEITKVPPLLIKSENSPPKNLKILAGVAKNNPNKTFFISPHLSAPSKTYWGSITKHPLSLGKPKIMSRPNIIPSTNQNSLIVSKTAIPRKRGRPPLSKEEKERNKKLRQATLFDLSNKLGMNQLNSNNEVKMLKIKTKCDMSTLSPPSSSYFQHPLIMSPYKSPVKRATTPEAIMRLPFMRRFLFEHKTIKGVFGQFRRYAHTMDLVLAKLSSAQIEMIPEESLKQDLLARQKKVQDKEFLEALTPEEKKQYVKDKARTMALERWKERKLKNLKVEDKTVAALIPLPKPSLVETPEPIANSMFGDIVMITDFIKCFRELLLGEEKFLISSCHLMETLHLGSLGNKVIVDIMCCLLPLIIHDDISKNCKEVGFPISVIPITYQTAHELARLCLRKQDDDDTAVLALEDAYQIGKEKSELSDELMNRLESCELWELSCEELVSLLKALVHKALCTASVSVYVEEVEEKVLKMKRERRKVLKDLQKDQKAEVKKKKEERMQNRLGKGPVQKRQRGRPRGRSPKSGSGILQEYFTCKMRDSEPLTAADQKRRLSMENSKKENEETLLSQKERQKQLEENQKRQGIDKKYDDMVIKRDNLIRRTHIGLDRDHNRYWIFHTTTPGLFVEKCWADLNTDYKYSLCKGSCSKKAAPSSKTKPVSDEDEKPLAVIASKENEEDNKLLASVKSELIQEENKPLAAIKSEIKGEVDEDNKPLSDVKSKLTISPMKMTYRGRPPKEAYVLMDEDTQTFPEIGENSWYYYKSIEDIQKLVSCLSDEGQRESQLKAAINVNMDRIQKHFNINSEPLNLNPESPNRLKGSLKEDIIQIEKELIEGWLGQVPSFDDWEHKVKEADDVTTLGALLIEAQRHMQIKYLKSVMAPVKEQIVAADAPEGASAEYEDVEGPGVERWREAVLSCRTYSRLHVLVGLFDSCIKWEKSMATRKCKVCRNKTKEIPLAMCDKCHISYHYFCLRPPLKEDPGESWTCPACKPKKTRREEKQATEPAQDDDPEEKNDPTFSVVKVKRQYRKRKSLPDKSLGDQASRVEKECVICFGRIGLIFCAHCSTAYHSECHNPPLMSRARKDWVCGACSNHPKSEIARKVKTDAPNNPNYRRNYFGNVEEVERPKRRGNTTGLRDRYGRFLKNIAPPQPGSVQSSNGEGDSMEPAEDIEPQMDKFGRHIRGAKAKALENISVDKKHKGSKDSRRSSRNPCKRQSYKDDSENENSVSDEDADEESENGDSDSENESSESRDENESENEEAENENDKFDSDDKNRRKLNNVNINKNKDTKANVNAKRRINSDNESTSEDESDSEETEESEDEVNTCIKNEGESDSEEKEESEDDVNNSEDEVNDCTKNESNESDGDDSENENENDSTSDEEETDSEGSSGLNSESEYEEFSQNKNKPSWRTLGSYEGADKERTMRK